MVLWRVVCLVWRVVDGLGRVVGLGSWVLGLEGEDFSWRGRRVVCWIGTFRLCVPSSVSEWVGGMYVCGIEMYHALITAEVWEYWLS